MLTCYCVDKNGNEVPDASPYVKFMTNKLGCIVGTGSDVCDDNPAFIPTRKMYMGKVSVGVKVGSEAGLLKVYAEAENLLSSYVEFKLC